MDDLLRDFITETSESLDVVDNQLVSFEREPNNAAILAGIFRLVHTIKGTCGFLGLPRLEALTHAAETLMGRFRDGAEASAAAVTLILATIDRIKLILDALETAQAEPAGSDADLIGALQAMTLDAREPPAEQAGSPPPAAPPPAPAAAESRIAEHSIRIDVDMLEHLLATVSELVLTRNQLIDILRQHADSTFAAPLQRLSSVTAELQDGIMKARMQPIGHAWQKLPRLVRDLAAGLGKQIALDMQGGDTELDRQILGMIKDPLTHMIRNSADHGLETPAERLAAGKPAQGTIRLSAYHEGGFVLVSVADDGRGLDTAAIRARALAAGLVGEADIARLNETQIHRFIYAPGFSTAASVTSISGRGVGMDVVRDHIERIGGAIDVKSVPGEGSRFTIRIPLTLAIVSALIVDAGAQRFALPRLAVAEILRADSGDECRVEHVQDTPVLRLRGRLLPLVHLGRLLKTADAGNGGYVVVMEVGRHRFGVMVDGVVDVIEIVAKPMATRLRHIAAFSGSTILGDGSVIMIVDPNGILRTLGAAGLSGDTVEDAEPQAEADRTSLLVFRAGSRQPRAVPLSLVTRIEEIDVARIEMSDGRRMIQYRGRLMPLVVMDGARLRDAGPQPVLLFVDDDRTMGLVVDDVVDIVEGSLVLDVAGHSDGVIGSALVRGEATEIVDIGHFLPLAFADHFTGRRPVETRAVLLVDDSAFFRNLLTPVLQAAGYRVAAAATAQEALAMLRAGHCFDAVVADTDRPQIDGFGFAQAVRADGGLRGAPLIALSSTMSRAVIARGRQAGFDDHVAKFDRIGLIAALRGHAAALDRVA